MYNAPPHTHKFAGKTFQGVDLQKANSSKINSRNSIAEEVDETYNRLAKLSKEDNAAEKLILGEYDEEMKDLQERFKDPAFKREFMGKVNTELDKELVKNPDTSTRKSLISTKNFLFKTVSMPEYTPSQLISFKGERYINTIKRNANIGNDLSRLRTTAEKTNFENKLKNSRFSFWSRESCWDSESSFDDSVISAMKESTNKRDRIKRLIKNSTNMSESKLEDKLHDVEWPDLTYLYNNAKELADLRDRNDGKKLRNVGVTAAGGIIGFLGVCLASTGIGLPFAIPALGAGLAGLNYEFNENDRKNEKNNGLKKFTCNDLTAHLINIKLKRLVIKDKTRVREIYNIINN